MQPAELPLLHPTLVDRINKCVSAGLQPLKKPEPQKMSEWADQYFYLSAESSAIEGRWETLPYQRSIMNTIGNDDVRVTTLFKAARIGYTKIICAAVGYHAEHKKRNQVIWQPTDDDAMDFEADEIGPMIRDVPVVRKTMLSDPDKKSRENTKHRKAFSGSVLDIKGGKSARNYRRMTKDVAYYDELDGFDDDIEGEGSPTSLGDVRITNSSFPKSVRGSTPSTKDASQIESSLADADMVFRRYVPCPDCGEYQYLKWSGMTWTNNDPKTTKHACEHCGSLIDYSELPDIDAAGQWRTEDGNYLDEDDNFCDVKGKKIDPPFHAGFVIWAAYSYFTSWAELVAEFLKANAAAKRGDVAKLKTFNNTRLGELWEEKNVTVESDTLTDRLEHYGPDIPEGAYVLTAAVDVQDNRLEVEVVAWGKDKESWSIEYNRIIGDTSADPDLENSVWADLDDYLLTNFTHENGKPMRIACATIDLGGHRTENVYKFCKARFRRRVYAVKGMDGPGKPIVGKLTPSRKYKANFIPVGVDTCKELVYSRLKLTTPGPGYCHFPAHYNDEYFDMLTSEKCVTKFVRGKRSRAWMIKSSGRRNEALDCRNYNMAALELLNANFDMLAKRFAEYQQEPAKQKKKATRRQPGRRKSFATNWRR